MKRLRAAALAGLAVVQLAGCATAPRRAGCDAGLEARTIDTLYFGTRAARGRRGHAGASGSSSSTRK